MNPFAGACWHPGLASIRQLVLDSVRSQPSARPSQSAPSASEKKRVVIDGKTFDLTDAQIAEVNQAATDAVIAHRAQKAQASASAPAKPVRNYKPIACGWHGGELSDFQQNDPAKYAAIISCYNAIQSPRYGTLCANLRHAAFAAIGDRFSLDRAKQTRALQRYFAAARSGSGIVDRAAHERANAALGQLRDLGVNTDVLAPGYVLPGLA